MFRFLEHNSTAPEWCSNQTDFAWYIEPWKPSTFDLLSFLVCGILSGLLIGAIGIGGVILVPLLTFALSVDIYQSIAASIFAFVVSGFVGTFLYAKRKVISWREIKFIWIGAAPSTLCGALLLSSVSKELLTLLIAFLTLGSAARALLKQPKKIS